MVTKGLLFLGSGHLFPLRYKRSCYYVALETQCKAGIFWKLPLERIGLSKILGRLFLLSEFWLNSVLNKGNNHSKTVAQDQEHTTLTRGSCYTHLLQQSALKKAGSSKAKLGSWQTKHFFFLIRKKKIRIVLKKPINSHQTDERLTRSAMHKDSNFSGRIRSAQMIPYTLDLVTFKRTAGLEQLSFSSTQKKKARLYRFPI